MDQAAIERDLREFLIKLEQEFQPESVLLFGSRARGDFRWNSDYDLMIISQRFSGMRWQDRISQLIKLWDRNDMVDMVAYTPEEFAAKQAKFISIRDAVAHSILLSTRKLN